MTDYPPSSLVKTKGKWYVNLTIPVELREHFRGQKQLRASTGTSDKVEAKRKQHGITTGLYARLDGARPDPLQGVADALGFPVEEVHDLIDDGSLGDLIAGRMHMALPGQDLEDDLAIQKIKDDGARAKREWESLKARRKVLVSGDGITLSGAASAYLESKPYPKHKTAKEAATALEEFQAFAGDVTLDSITTTQGYAYADHVGQTKSSKTVSKKLGYVRRLFEFYVRNGTVAANPLAGMSIPKNIGTTKTSYRPFTLAELEALFGLEMKPHIKLLLSILIASGMRLDEAALLDWEDVKKEGGIVYFDLTHRADTVKNIGSARKVPVHSALSDKIAVGMGEGQMFPQFKRNADGKAQGPASKACMAQIRKITDDKSKVVHSLRGNFKDMLRDVDASKEVNDFITGHGSGDVAGSYGSGPSLAKRQEAIERISLVFLS